MTSHEAPVPSMALFDEDHEDALLRRRARARRMHGLYVLTPELPDTGRLGLLVAAALDGGAAAVQYRAKDASAALRLAQARLVARIVAARGGVYIVNDDAALAREVDAHGVHIGATDGSIAAARALLGPERLIGVSCYGDVDRAREAVAEGADYVAFGSFFPSSTKPAARRADPAVLSAAQALGVPVVAIGGITAGNAGTLIDAGADALAIIADVFGHEDPADVRAAADAITRLYARHTKGRT
jgi:thiamine-phosphate pyrophosphorylase